jgi:hypothetical protein
MRIQNVFDTLQTILGLFKILRLEFDEVATLMVPTIQAHARFMDEVHIVTM